MFCFDFDYLLLNGYGLGEQMASLYVLGIIEIIALVLIKLLGIHDSVFFTIIGMMIVTFGYIFENLLMNKKSFRHRRKIIVFGIFGLTMLVYWLFNFI